jgi:hypothetical protein
MPKKPKYTVVTPHGTFTRDTHREYSHIVVVGRLKTEHIERHHRMMIMGLPADSPERGRWDARREEKLAARESGSDCRAEAWCGRRALADGVARRLMRDYDLVEIYETGEGKLVYQHYPELPEPAIGARVAVTCATSPFPNDITLRTVQKYGTVKQIVNAPDRPFRVDVDGDEGQQWLGCAPECVAVVQEGGDV